LDDLKMNVDRIATGALLAILAQLGGCTTEQVYYDTPRAQAPAPAVAWSAPPPASVAPPAPRALVPQAGNPPAPSAALPAAPAPGATQLSAAQAADFDRELTAVWVAAVKATPQLSARIAQGASYGSVMAQADQMARRGAARLSMEDVRAMAGIYVRLMEVPGICDAAGNHAAGGALQTRTLIQAVGADTLRQYQELRIKALRAESENKGTARTVSREDFLRALGMAIRTLPFEKGQALAQLFGKEQGGSAHDKCVAGSILLAAGLRLPEPYQDTIAIASLSPNVLREAALPPLAPSQRAPNGPAVPHEPLRPSGPQVDI
jgi:hypothetical protein